MEMSAVNAELDSRATVGNDQSTTTSTMAPTQLDPATTSYSWMHTQVHKGHTLAQVFDDMRTWQLLDSQSSVDLLCNPKYVNETYP